MTSSSSSPRLKGIPRFQEKSRQTEAQVVKSGSKLHSPATLGHRLGERAGLGVQVGEPDMLVGEASRDRRAESRHRPEAPRPLAAAANARAA